VLGAHLHAASLHDRDGGQRFLTEVLQGKMSRLAILWADAASRAGSGSGSRRSAGGMWRCCNTPTSSCGATG
jgi:hypothetical protein